MTLNFKTIFLVDACGALVSAIIIGLVLPRVVSLIGLPIPTLQILAAIALTSAAYSFSCYWILPPARRLLATIIIGNLLYCVLTASILVTRFDEMTMWGILYFVAEILIIFSLVAVELNVFRKMINYH